MSDAIHDAENTPSGREPNELLPLLYDELRRLAAYKLANEAPGQTLQPTALVHDAYYKLTKNGTRTFENRQHFFACVAEAMRQILVDTARRKRTVKHGGEHSRSALPEDAIAASCPDEDLLRIHEVIDLLAEKDQQAATVVKLRFCAGMTMKEISESMELTRRQVDRLWAYARAFLIRELEESHK